LSTSKQYKPNSFSLSQAKERFWNTDIAKKYIVGTYRTERGMRGWNCKMTTMRNGQSIELTDEKAFNIIEADRKESKKILSALPLEQMHRNEIEGYIREYVILAMLLVIYDKRDGKGRQHYTPNTYTQWIGDMIKPLDNKVTRLAYINKTHFGVKSTKILRHDESEEAYLYDPHLEKLFSVIENDYTQVVGEFLIKSENRKEALPNNIENVLQTMNNSYSRIIIAIFMSFQFMRVPSRIKEIMERTYEGVLEEEKGQAIINSIIDMSRETAMRSWKFVNTTQPLVFLSEPVISDHLSYFSEDTWRVPLSRNLLLVLNHVSRKKVRFSLATCSTDEEEYNLYLKNAYRDFAHKDLYIFANPYDSLYLLTLDEDFINTFREKWGQQISVPFELEGFAAYPGTWDKKHNIKFNQ
jgi:hypothetical protein